MGQAIRSYYTGLSHWPVSAAILHAKYYIKMGVLTLTLFYKFN